MSLRVMGQAAVTMNQLQQQLDVIGHNIANANTTGYKQRTSEFSDLLFQQIHNMTQPGNEVGRSTNDGIRIGTGAKLGAVNNDFSIGSLQNTDRPLDIALTQPTHFMQVITNVNGREEIQYTRDGSLYVSSEGNDLVLVSKDGHPINGENGPIRFSNNIDSIRIGTDGRVYVTENGAEQYAGTIQVRHIKKPRLLEATGDNIFQLRVQNTGFNEAEIAQLVDENNIMESGKLEMANVDIGLQMVELMNAQRAYQVNARSITMADQMQGLVNQLR